MGYVFCTVTVTFDHQTPISSPLSPSGLKWMDATSRSRQWDGQPENLTTVAGADAQKTICTYRCIFIHDPDFLTQ